MTTHVQSNVLDNQLAAPSRSRRRSPWRQRLVDVERGFAISLRGDGAFFIHFFSASVVIAAGFVLGISLVEWSVVVVSVMLTLCAEMFRQALKAVVAKTGHFFDDKGRSVLRVAAAGVVLSITGATIAVGLIFTRAIVAMFGA